MSELTGEDAIRDALRDVLRELLPAVLPPASAPALGAPTHNGHGANGHTRNGQTRDVGSGHTTVPAAVVPLVPAPPVAAVLRPSTWAGPPIPGEIVGDGGSVAPTTMSQRPRAPVQSASPRPSAPATAPLPPIGPRPSALGGTVETVRLDSDDDLQVFVRSLVARLENPRDRLAIKAGRLRFQLQRSAAPVGSQTADIAPAVRVTKGAVTERHVREAHATGARLVLARAAVLTPLARDSARALDVQIERESQC